MDGFAPPALLEGVIWQSLANCILGMDGFCLSSSNRSPPPPTSTVGGGGEEALKAVRCFTASP